MKFSLDKDSRRMLHDASDEVFVGVIDENSLRIVLYRAGWRNSPPERTVRGHQQLLDLGKVAAKGHLGFSFHVKNGKLDTFYRNSVLNLRKTDYCISEAEMNAIIAALGLRFADDFRSYP